MTDAALFDWDGTLLDSRAVLLHAWRTASGDVLGRRFPASADEEDLVFTLSGAILFPRLAGDRAGELRAAFQAAYAQVDAGVRAFDGVPEMLAALRAEGVAVGVVTSKSRTRYARDVEHAGLAGLVDVAVCSEDTDRHKPDPAPVRHALAALGAQPARSAMTGDTPVDLAAGAAAGTRVLGVAWGHGGAQALLDAGASGVAREPGELVRLVLQRHEERVTT